MNEGGGAVNARGKQRQVQGAALAGDEDDGTVGSGSGEVRDRRRRADPGARPSLLELQLPDAAEAGAGDGDLAKAQQQGLGVGQCRREAYQREGTGGRVRGLSYRRGLTTLLGEVAGAVGG